MSDFKDIKVGDTVWLEDRSPSYRGAPKRELIEGTVLKVGREYFYTGGGGWRERKFYLDDGWEWCPANDNGVYKWRAWRFKEEYERHMEEASDRSKMEAFFRDYSSPKKLTHEQVKAILSIIQP